MNDERRRIASYVHMISRLIGVRKTSLSANARLELIRLLNEHLITTDTALEFLGVPLAS